MLQEGWRDIAVADVGGTHARFAVAKVGRADGILLRDIVTFKTADHDGLKPAWDSFVERLGWRPDAAAIAVAAPIDNQTVRLTNSRWTFRQHEVASLLSLEQVLLMNDFVAVANAVAVVGPRHLLRLYEGNESSRSASSITIMGPGTGLGTARIIRSGDSYQVFEAEGGHIAFAPLDEVEDTILQRLRTQYGRVSVERVVSGPGLAAIYSIMAAREPSCEIAISDEELWARAVNGTDPLASAALRRFCACLGSIAGDLVLANGSDSLVIAGGLGLRLIDHLASSAFVERFRDKGRLSERMENVSISILTLPHAGLIGAAAAFAGSRDELNSEL